MEQENKLPEGVGQKIVDALKKQTEEAAQAEKDFSPEAMEAAQVSEEEYKEYEAEPIEAHEEVPSQSETFVQAELPRVAIPVVEAKTGDAQFLNTSNYPNVDLVNNLIGSLPAGITKQTGARIVRQTMEAMGVSMNGVFSEAQKAQEKLASKIKIGIEKMEAHKSGIRQLEKEVRICRTQSQELSDLINLFIVTEKKD